MFRRTVKNKKGQAAVEYVLTTAALFAAFVSFYIFYSQTVPLQFEQGARIILTTYDPKGTD
ncbi:hypothetical protein Dip518_000433 [Parelusimicrobium proximum]|uniref:hypothetical protein n=1 Tax=Parelusimicrobium proximum TaxID=3228953 RepID=UPI003D16CAE8